MIGVMFWEADVTRDTKEGYCDGGDLFVFRTSDFLFSTDYRHCIVEMLFSNPKIREERYYFAIV